MLRGIKSFDDLLLRGINQCRRKDLRVNYLHIYKTVRHKYFGLILISTLISVNVVVHYLNKCLQIFSLIADKQRNKL